MCTHSRWIYNPYARRKILVSCGHCPACLQEKACNRSNRIRNHYQSGTAVLFLTLTYTNDFVPYIKRSDLYSCENNDINVYRNMTGRYVYDRFSNKVRFKKSPFVSVVKSVFLDAHELCDSDIELYHSLNGLGKDKIGVLCYDDLQKFFKRLRIILQRNYNYEKKFSFFACSELGSHSFRPHFHSLLFIPQGDDEIFRNAILEAWPFADSRRTKKYIEFARDAASYVSSYINSHIDLLPIMQNDVFKPKHSYSQHFGTLLDCFQLPEILHKIDTRNLYYYSKKKFDGVDSVVTLPIPEYILNRYFPKFKGLRWLSSHELFSVLSSPERIGYVLRDATLNIKFFTNNSVYDVTFNSSPHIGNPLYHYSNLETYRIYVRLEHCYQFFHQLTGLGRFDYAFYYMMCWSLHNSQTFKDSYKDIESIDDFSDFYSNALDMTFDPDISPTLKGLSLQIDPNKRIDIIKRSNKFLDLFGKLDKTKKVTNYVMSKNGHYV